MKSKFNRYRVHRLRIDAEDWKKKGSLKQPSNQQEGTHDMESSISERENAKKKTREEEPRPGDNPRE